METSAVARQTTALPPRTYSWCEPAAGARGGAPGPRRLSRGAEGPVRPAALLVPALLPVGGGRAWLPPPPFFGFGDLGGGDLGGCADLGFGDFGFFGGLVIG